MARPKRQIDIEKVVEKINELESVQLGCSEFGLDVVVLFNRLKQEGKKITKTFSYTKIEDPNILKNIKPRKRTKIQDMDEVFRHINEKGSIGLGCVYAGITDSTLKGVLLSKGLKIRKTYQIVDLV